MKLSVTNLSTKIEDKMILRDISLMVESKQFIGLLGANGSGKSTLLKTIYKTLNPVKGTIFLDDLNISTSSFKEMAKQMAVVGQFNATDFDFSVFDFVMMGRYPHKKRFGKIDAEDKAIVISTLEVVGMGDYQKRMVSTLSGGEKQRIVLARALAQQPKCIILDEPTNHLDIKYQLQLFSLLKKVHITTVIAIHDIAFAYNFCDKVYALKEGAILAYGAPEEVITADIIEQIYGVKIDLIRCPNRRVAVSYLD